MKELGPITAREWSGILKNGSVWKIVLIHFFHKKMWIICQEVYFFAETKSSSLRRGSFSTLHFCWGKIDLYLSYELLDGLTRFENRIQNSSRLLPWSHGLLPCCVHLIVFFLSIAKIICGPSCGRFIFKGLVTSTLIANSTVTWCFQIFAAFSVQPAFSIWRRLITSGFTIHWLPACYVSYLPSYRNMEGYCSGHYAGSVGHYNERSFSEKRRDRKISKINVREARL